MRLTSIIALSAALSIALVPGGAMAQSANEAGITPTAPVFFYPEPPTPTASFLAALRTVCDPSSPFAPMLSVTVRDACDRQSFPALVADGTRFASRGLGAELNTMIEMAARVSVASVN